MCVSRKLNQQSPAVQANSTWHPQIDDVVYWGMDWICPNDNRMLATKLQALHGELDAANTISDVMPYVGTGDLHSVVYDHAAMLMYVATARPDGGSGPLPAYLRAFTRLDMRAIFDTPAPTIE